MVAEQTDDEESRGRAFLRAMADQSARAHDFDRRMRWFWLRWMLTDRTTGPTPDEVQLPDEVIVLPEVVTSTVAPVVPLQRS
jgi:hypothetical protein